ncbi:MAG: mechanosensitive ion channel family protein [Alphaproteobacteria bacterium]
MLDYVVKYWSEYSEKIIGLSYNLFLVIVILVVSKLAAKVMQNSIDRANKKFEKLDETLVPILKSSVTYLIYIVGLIIILDIFGVNTNSFIALIGAAGVAIGLALKDTLQNIAAGIMLLFLRPFRSGDYIECGGIGGTIKEINIFTTILETPDGIYISAPNNTLWGSEIRNYSFNTKRRLNIVVGISYDDSIDDGIKVLRDIVSKDERLLKDPEPQFMVSSLGDSSVNLQLRVWAKSSDYWNIYWDMNKLVKEKIEEAGLTIPFPQTDVHIKEK